MICKTKTGRRLLLLAISAVVALTMAAPTFADEQSAQAGSQTEQLTAQTEQAGCQNEQPDAMCLGQQVTPAGYDGDVLDDNAAEMVDIDGQYYMVDQYGEPIIGWVVTDEGSWYTNEEGIVQSGLKKVDGEYYYFYPYDDEYYGIMCDVGIYKNYVISYTGVCYKMPTKKKDKKCNKMAKLIAKCSGKYASEMTDLEKVERAAITVSAFYDRCKYTMKGKYYNKPYGVFYAKRCSCAGTTRALGLVLSKMGYKWKHQNKNKYKHQWCVLTMDGQKGWADGQIGMADYGKHPAAR
ncbi:MAG: hypothetical protein Q4A65_09045 [Bacillota bacterium]|nr:hypothetical protein [Bacillota bacterium]